MNRILLSILLLGVALARATDTDDMMGSGDATMMMLTTPVNLAAEPSSSSVLITWDMVEGATGYQVTIENVTDQNAQESQILISGLMPLTTYTAMIKATKDDEMSEAAEITFTTLLAGVQNLAVVEATETEIEISWSAVEGAATYTVSVQADGSDSLESNIITAETTARIIGLTAITQYNIFVTAQSPDGPSDVTTLRTRTDGAGVMVDGVWQNSETDIFGGQILVLRPLQIPRGSYSVQVIIPCALATVNTWNADVNMEISDLGAGVVVVTQSQSWQRAISEIGMNFEFEEGINCTFGADEPRASFDFNVPSDLQIETISAPVVRVEWLDVPVEVRSAGLVRVRLNQLFRDTNAAEDEESELRPKPAVYDSIIAINPGAECPGGVIPTNPWSMSLRNVEGIVGALPGVMYFVQEGSDWYSNEAGLIYGYDPELCPNRTELSAEVMIGGSFVQAVVDAPNADI